MEEKEWRIMRTKKKWKEKEKSCQQKWKKGIGMINYNKRKAVEREKNKIAPKTMGWIVPLMFFSKDGFRIK